MALDRIGSMKLFWRCFTLDFTISTARGKDLIGTQWIGCTKRA